MYSARLTALEQQPIYIEADNFVNQLSNQTQISNQTQVSNQTKYCLFVDIDGTLAEFTLNPKDSVIPKPTLSLLRQIQAHGVTVAAVTGRSLIEAKQMLQPLQVAIAATHGLEIAFVDDPSNCDSHQNSNVSGNVSGVNIDLDALGHIKQSVIESCLPYPNLTVEDKPYSCALHYRQNPALRDVAYRLLSKAIETYADWTLKPGKYVWEAVPIGVNKGTAIVTLLKQIQGDNTLYPIFIGDDTTDEAGFSAIQNATLMATHNLIPGIGIKVGNEPTCAQYYVNNIPEVTILLQSFADFCHSRSSRLDDPKPSRDCQLANTHLDCIKTTTKHTI